MQSRAADFRIGQGWRELPKAFAESECGTIGRDLIQALRECILKLATDSAQVRRDSTLPEFGSERRFRSLAAKARSNKKIASAVALWRNAYQERERLLECQIREAACVDPPDGPLEIALDSEIRAYLRGLDEEQRSDFLEQAVQRGETRPVRAVLTAPTFLSGMTQRERDDLLRKASWLHTAAEPQELEALRRATELILVAQRSFERIIQELTGDRGTGSLEPTGEERRYTPRRREDQQVLGPRPIGSDGAFHPRAGAVVRMR